MLRRYLVSLTLCVCALIGLAYLLRVLPPVDEDGIKSIVTLQEITSEEQLIGAIRQMTQDGLIVNYLNWRNVIVNTILLCIAVFSGFVLAHSLVDRVFFSKFYQEPNLPTAIRRAAFVCLCVIFTIFFHLYNAGWYLFPSIYAFALILEVLITQSQQRPDTQTFVTPAPAPQPENFLLVEVEETVVVEEVTKVEIKPDLSTNPEDVDNFR